MRVDIQTIPRQLHDQEKAMFSAFYETTADSIKVFLSKEQIPINTKHACTRCLLLLYFLQRDKPNYQRTFEQLKKTDQKINGIALKYFDLELLWNFEEKKLQQATHAMDYDQLLRIYFQWQLLLQNLIAYKYDKALIKANKCDNQVSPEELSNLLTFIIDWNYKQPIKDYFLRAIRASIAKSLVDNDFWKTRNYQLPTKEARSPIKVGVWDTGVDINSIPNTKSDLGLSYDKYSLPTEQTLLPLSKYTKQDFLLCKGWNDLKIGKDTAAAKTLLEQLANYDKNDLIKFNKLINFFVLYSHGTKVASVITVDNPNAVIIPIRITFDPKMRFPTYFTLRRAKNEVKMYQQIFASIKKNKVRIVNMSWVYNKEEIELSLINNGMTEEKSRMLVRDEIFDLLKRGLYEGMKNNPATLFLAGAGNSNELVIENESIPAGLKLPNLLSIGAVNRYGQRTSFTCIGEGVQLYANGEHISCMAPDSMEVVSSGTSLAAPNVANLAVKLLAIQPSLTTLQLRQLLLNNATTTAEDILVINPKKTIEKVVDQSLAGQLEFCNISS